MILIEIPNFQEVIACRLGWHVLDPFAEKTFGNEQLNQLINEGNKLACRFKNGSDVNVGVSPAIDMENIKISKVIPIASYLATTQRFRQTTSLIVIKNPANESQVFMIGLVSGNVVIDEIVSTEEVEPMYEKYIAMCNHTGRIYFVHGDVPLDEKQTPYSLAEMLQDKSAKKTPIEALKNDKKMVYLVYLIIAFTVAMGSYKGWAWHQSKGAEEARLIEESRRSPKNLYTQAVKSLVAGQHIVLANSALKIIEMIERFPAQTGGWRLEELTCDDENCNTEWASEGGTYEDFKAANNHRKEWGAFSLNTGPGNVLGDLKTIRFSFKPTFIRSRLPEQSKWPAANDFAFSMGTAWQKTPAWKGSISQPEIQGVPQGVNELAVRSHALAITGMRWEAADQPWSVAKKILPTFPPNVVLRNFKVQVKPSGITFSGSGIAYVNK